VQNKIPWSKIPVTIFIIGVTVAVGQLIMKNDLDIAHYTRIAKTKAASARRKAQAISDSDWKVIYTDTFQQLTSTAGELPGLNFETAYRVIIKNEKGQRYNLVLKEGDTYWGVLERAVGRDVSSITRTV